MKLTFKNVGQGDSIILEWFDEKASKKRLGIIDCKKNGNLNPILDQIKKQKDFDDIAFVIMSHPHYDHFSGIFELLSYCNLQKIKIEHFGMTAYLHRAYISWFDYVEENIPSLLEDIFHKVITMRNAEMITNSGHNLTPSWCYDLNNGFKIRCLSPSNCECELYTKEVKYFREKSNEYHASKAANHLSSVFAIESENSYLLLTSDCTMETFNRIRKEKGAVCTTSKLILAQVPHHGAKGNHNIGFWQRLTKDTNCPAVISAGQNDRYCHPHISVIKDFDAYDFKVYSTNCVNGMKDFMSLKSQIAACKLSMTSRLVEVSDFGDLSFEYCEGEMLKV